MEAESNQYDEFMDFMCQQFPEELLGQQGSATSTTTGAPPLRPLRSEGDVPSASTAAGDDLEAGMRSQSAPAPSHVVTTGSPAWLGSTANNGRVARQALSGAHLPLTTRQPSPALIYLGGHAGTSTGGNLKRGSWPGHGAGPGRHGSGASVPTSALGARLPCSPRTRGHRGQNLPLRPPQPPPLPRLRPAPPQKQQQSDEEETLQSLSATLFENDSDGGPPPLRCHSYPTLPNAADSPPENAELVSLTLSLQPITLLVVTLPMIVRALVFIGNYPATAPFCPPLGQIACPVCCCVGRPPLITLKPCAS